MHTHLILPAPAGVVQVVIAPVVMGPVLCLLIQPVELVGAALHVVLQGVQILLPLLGAGLGRVEGESSAQSSSLAGPPNKGSLPKGIPCPQDSRDLLLAASGTCLGSRSCIPGKGGEARQELGACLWRLVAWQGLADGGGCGVYGMCFIVQLELVCDSEL